MALFEQINDDIKKAMLAREKEKLEALRAIKSALLLLKTESSNTVIKPEDELKLLQKLVKQRKESAEIYKSQNRGELYDKEMEEAAFIEAYLPKQFSDEELTAEVTSIIEQTGAKGPQDMGKVMGVASKQLSGKAEGKLIAEKVKQLLAAKA